MWNFISGICKKCEENYVFIYKGHLYLECVSLDSEELRNCEEYDCKIIKEIKLCCQKFIIFF